MFQALIEQGAILAQGEKRRRVWDGFQYFGYERKHLSILFCFVFSASHLPWMETKGKKGPNAGYKPPLFFGFTQLTPVTDQFLKHLLAF